MTITRLVAVVLVAVALTGCDSGRPSADAVLQRVLPATVAEEGFVVDAAATGPMSEDTAAEATTLRPAVLRDFLRKAQYDAGYARVLTRDGEFVSLLAYQFGRAGDARALVDLALGQLASSVAFRPFDDPGVAGSRGFTLTSEVRGQVRFCVGEWFAVATRAYAVTRCAPFVLSVPAVTGIAATLHARAERSAAT
jgi:hypothetical protein